MHDRYFLVGDVLWCENSGAMTKTRWVLNDFIGKPSEVMEARQTVAEQKNNDGCLCAD